MHHPNSVFRLSAVLIDIKCTTQEKFLDITKLFMFSLLHNEQEAPLVKAI